ncbi:MAG TPA: hypothetical protein VKY27_12455 [Bacteriovoracaceae bacterium]|nr:hypothetical protein [Bacteriovoracaceae bacterium]
MKKLLMVLAIATFSFALMAQTESDPSNQGSSTEVMGAQEEVYPEGPGSSPGSSTVQEEEENVDDPALQDDSMMQDDSTIQEEVETDTEGTMRSDTMEGTESPEGTDSSSEGTSTP